MRIPIVITVALLIYLIGTSGCEKCMCCSSNVLADVICIKDSTALNIFTGNGTLQNVTARTQDTFNYYTEKGYSCTQSIEPDQSEWGRVCGPIRIKQDEQGGYDCVAYSYACEP